MEKCRCKEVITSPDERSVQNALDESPKLLANGSSTSLFKKFVKGLKPTFGATVEGYINDPRSPHTDSPILSGDSTLAHSTDSQEAVRLDRNQPLGSSLRQHLAKAPLFQVLFPVPVMGGVLFPVISRSPTFIAIPRIDLKQSLFLFTVLTHVCQGVLLSLSASVFFATHARSGPLCQFGFANALANKNFLTSRAVRLDDSRMQKHPNAQLRTESTGTVLLKNTAYATKRGDGARVKRFHQQIRINMVKRNKLYIKSILGMAISVGGCEIIGKNIPP